MENYEEFYEQEMTFRRLLRYPPACELLVIFCTSKDENTGIEALNRIARFLEQTYGKDNLSMIGPGEGAFPKINDTYRRVLYLKEEKEERLVQIRKKVEQYLTVEEIFSKVHIYFDKNPMGIY